MIIVRKFWPAIFVFSALALGACEGDDGQDGATGAQGDPGSIGPPGPPGPPGANTVPIDSVDIFTIETTNVSIPAGGGAPTVSFALKSELGQGLTGLPASTASFVIAQLTPGTGGGSSEWQSYVTRDSAGIPNAQASGENGGAGTFVDNNDGTYEYTFAMALTDYPAGPVFDETKTHRIGIDLRGVAPTTNNGIYDFVPTGGAPLFERKIVDNDTCFACHDIINFHGGPRHDVEYCVTCHNPSSIDGDTVDEAWGGAIDMKALVHKIHYGYKLTEGYFIIGHRNSLHDYSDIHFPQDVRNCGTCHDEDDAQTPQASNWRLVQNREACGTCHDHIDWAAGDHAGGLVFVDDTLCANCHGPDSTVNNGDVRVAKAHELPVQIESERFAFKIIDAFDMGVGLNPTVHFSVTDPTNGDAPYDILNDVEFTTCGGGASRLQVSIAWDAVDYTNTGSGATPAQPVGMNALTCFGAPGATPVAGSLGVFALTAATAIPATASGIAAVTMDGHPAVEFEKDGVITVERIPVRNVIEYFGIDGATGPDRRKVVDVQNCDDCHKELSLHGNNRTDEPQVCVVCHNPNATDVNRRGVPCTDTLGTDDAPIDMKFMIHAIHAAPTTGVAYSACGFGNRPHTFDSSTVHYPGHINNCEACHDRGSYYPVDPAEVLGTTVDVGADTASPIDDVVISPNTAVCSTCHVEDLAKQHMMQNGGDFEATKAADSTLISSGVETCQLCHGEGRSADVEEMHHVRDFPFN